MKLRIHCPKKSIHSKELTFPLDIIKIHFMNFFYISNVKVDSLGWMFFYISRFLGQCTYTTSLLQVTAFQKKEMNLQWCNGGSFFSLRPITRRMRPLNKIT
jgi:hypothetical protein